LLGPSPDVLSELSAEDGEVGGAVDDGAEPHNVVEYAGVGDNVVRDAVLLKYCHSPTQPQLELEPDLIMGRKPPTQELLRHFQAT
jgi:hypothetical protein